MLKLQQEFKRWLNRAIGTGPYDVAPFEQIARSAGWSDYDPVDYPESWTGILFQEAGNWFEYPQSATPLVGELEPRTVGKKRRYLPTGIVPEPPRRIYSLSEGGIAGRQGIVYDTRTRRAVLETARSWFLSPREVPVLLAPRFPTPQHLDGIGLSLATLDAEGFFLFLHELMPKAALMKPFFDKVDYIFVNGWENSWHQNWLERAEVPIEKLIWVSGLSHYRCQQLIFSSALVRNAQPNPWSIAALRRLLQSTPSCRGRRWLWASRSDAKTRQLEWEAQFLKRWPQFEVVCFSELSPAEAVALCGEAKVFAGPHGAAFANLVFCPPQTCAIEFLPPRCDKHGYRRLAQVCGQHHAIAVVDFEQLDAEATLHASIEQFLTSVLPNTIGDRAV